MMWFDFHVHTRYSYDSLMSIKKMIKIAIKKGLSGFAVVDHDVFSKKFIINKINNINKNFFILFGMEIKTEWGDLIALHIDEEIKSRVFLECIDEIKEKGGISVLPHPYRGHNMKYIDKMIESVDWIEIWNARSSLKQNNQSLKYKDIKPYTVGSDAHFYKEIGLASLGLKDFESLDDLISSVEKSKPVFKKYVSPRRMHYYSSMIGTVRTGRYEDLFRNTIRKIKEENS